MVTRIRYTKHKGNILRSMRNFSGQQGALYKVMLDTENMTYKVINVRNSAIIRSTVKDNKTPPKHLNTLKRHAKKALQSCGVDFDLDYRS